MVSLDDFDSHLLLQRYLGLGVIWGTGLLMGFMEIQHIEAMSSTVGIAAFAMFPFLLTLGLLVAGYVLWNSQFDGTETLQIAGWVVVGIVVIGLLATWTITHQNIRGRSFAHARFVTVNNMSAGGVVGFLVGWYKVGSARHQQAIEDEQAKLDFLRQLLRHNVLNGMQIVLGRVDFLVENVPESERNHLTTIRERSNEIVRLINGVRAMNMSSFDSASASLQRTDLSDVLATEVDLARRDFEQAEFSLDFPDDVVVMADDFLRELFSNLLANAVQHNDTDTPQVTVSATDTPDAIVVHITDNGPGIPDDEKEAMLTWNRKGSESTGTGLGLAIADTLTRNYDGSLWMEDNDPRGTVVNVELPRVSENR